MRNTTKRLLTLHDEQVAEYEAKLENIKQLIEDYRNRLKKIEDVLLQSPQVKESNDEIKAMMYSNIASYRSIISELEIAIK